MKHKRIVAAVLCCLCLFCSLQVFASAAEPSGVPPDISLRWSSLWNITLSMSYYGGEIHWVGQIAGNPGTQWISVTYTLERQSSGGGYTFVDSWSDSTISSETLVSSGSVSAPKGTYRLSVSTQVENAAGDYETATNSLIKTFS